LIEYNEGEAGKGHRAMCRKSVLAMVLATTLLLAAFGSCERRICAPGGF
jgi:hypothetical protein